MFLIISLAAAALLSFGTAYYLLTTRWDTMPAPLPPSAKLEHKAARSLSNLNSTANSTNTAERFLSYLLHSGFHNQRIAFENALVLARLLNRTLLVTPSVYRQNPLLRLHEITPTTTSSTVPTSPISSPSLVNATLGRPSPGTGSSITSYSPA